MGWESEERGRYWHLGGSGFEDCCVEAVKDDCS